MYIFQGKENFSLWSSGHTYQFNYYFTFNTEADCLNQTASFNSYTYPQDADYYHVFINFGEINYCDVRVFANATFERKQYFNPDPITTCTVNADQPSCSINTPSIHNWFAADYYISIDQFTEEVNWNEQISLTLFCQLITDSAQLAVKITVAFIVPLVVVLIGSVVIVCTCRYWWHYRQPQSDGQGAYGTIQQQQAQATHDDTTQQQSCEYYL